MGTWWPHRAAPPMIPPSLWHHRSCDLGRTRGCRCRGAWVCETRAAGLRFHQQTPGWHRNVRRVSPNTHIHTFITHLSRVINDTRRFLSVCMCVCHLLLSQNEHSSRFDGLPGVKIIPRSSLCSVLKNLPYSIPCQPGHTHVVPFPIMQREG